MYKVYAKRKKIMAIVWSLQFMSVQGCIHNKKKHEELSKVNHVDIEQIDTKQTNKNTQKKNHSNSTNAIDSVEDKLSSKFICAYEKRDFEKMTSLLNFKKNPDNINRLDKEGFALLHHAACYNDQGQFVKTLLQDFKADPNVISGSGKVPLHYACPNPHAVKVLLRYKANINLEDRNKIKPLKHAQNLQNMKQINLEEYKAIQQTINLIQEKIRQSSKKYNK